MTFKRNIRAVLFDLDGTLLDTAPDMAAALNRVRVEHGLQPLPYSALRPVVSHGARGLVDTGFGAALSDAERAPLIERFLELYAEGLAIDTSLFDGVDELLELIEASGRRWGIVTNKPGWLTTPLLGALGIDTRPGCIISGDSLPRRKPHPDPLHHAARLLGTNPSECIYVGDAERDIQAGLAAGMLTLIADYGYIGADDSPEHWNADGRLSHPSDLLRWLDGAVAV